MNGTTTTAVEELLAEIRKHRKLAEHQHGVWEDSDRKDQAARANENWFDGIAEGIGRALVALRLVNEEDL